MKKSQYEKEQEALVEEQLRLNAEKIRGMLAADPARDEKEALMNEATAYASQAQVFHGLRKAKFDGFLTVHTGWTYGAERFLTVCMKFFDRDHGNQKVCQNEYYLRTSMPIDRLKEEWMLMRSDIDAWVLSGHNIGVFT
jgi:hypothetical protein